MSTVTQKQISDSVHISQGRLSEIFTHPNRPLSRKHAERFATFLQISVGTVIDMKIDILGKVVSGMIHYNIQEAKKYE